MELALGKELNLERWFHDAEGVLKGITNNRSSIEFETLFDLPVLKNQESKVALIFGHPLWSTRPEMLNQKQLSAGETLTSQGMKAIQGNFFDIARKPLALLAALGITA